ncbi:MAG: AAA family ATPase [Smithellaceae bacterium]
MYCEYWGLHKAPFDNVPDPSMYSESHVTMEKVISETIFSIKEGNECFAVIIGDVGLGKTLSLRIIIDSLEPHKYKSVLITNPSISFSQLLREIIGQVTGKQCELKNKFILLELFNRLLFETVDSGQKIVIFIDEANAISPANLENLRLLTNMQDDQQNLFTLVLAGQMELAARLEHPKRANLFQRIGTYGRIDKLPSETAVKNYVETRLKLAGARRKIFLDDCMPVIWNHSEQGIPRLINKICKLCLKAGETNEFRTITPEIVSQIAERFQKLSQTAYQQRKPRNKPDIEFTEEEISALIAIEQIDDLPALSTSLSDNDELASLPAEETFSAENNIQTDSFLKDEEEQKIQNISEDESAEISALAEKLESETSTSFPNLQNETIFLQADESSRDISTSKPNDVEKANSPETICENAPQEKMATSQNHFKQKSANAGDENDELIIGEHTIRLNIPNGILKQVSSFNRESAIKSAGFWAAQIIKNHPELTRSSAVDPVHLWNEIKDTILKRI